MKKRWIQGIALFVAGLLAVWTGNKTVFASETDEKNVVRVGYTENGQTIRKNGNGFYGYGVEYLQRIADYTGWQYEYVLVTEEERAKALDEGKIDLLCDITRNESTAKMRLSEQSSGMSFGLLCTRKDDNSIFFDDYEAIDGKRIAINRSKGMEAILQEFAKDHGISYTPVYFTDFGSMEKALEDGSADLMLASNQRDLSGYKYVAKVGVQDQFFAVSVRRADLMRLLDYVDRQIKLQQPFLISVLYEKYYGRPSQVLTGISREEYEFIHSGRKIRVVCDADSYPVEYIDEAGNYRGIYADAMQLIAEESGLQFEFVPLDDYSKAWDMLVSGEADMSAGMFFNEVEAKDFGIGYTSSYLNADYTMIGRAGETLPEKPVIVIPKQYIGVRYFMEEEHPEWQLVFAANTDECLKQVEQKKADGTVVNSVFLQTIYNLNQYRNLVIMPMQDMTLPISCGIGNGPDAEILKGILNKTILKIPQDAFERCEVENAINISYEPSVTEILRKFVPFWIGIVVCMVVVFIFSLKAREKHFRHLAMTDEVTGLWNGHKFRMECEELLQHNKQKNYQIISLDMERFKYVNNDFGERAADGILQVIGKRIHKQFGNDSYYAREMADIFLILTEKQKGLEERIHEISEEILFENNGMEQRYKPSVKFGICDIEPQSMDGSVSEYIDRAGIARKSIKGSTMQEIAYYNQQMADEIYHERKIEMRMENALKQKEFLVYFQPKFQLRSETIIGAEALVRWKDPKEGLIPPGQFIPIFERNGFVVQLDFYVYEEVLKCMSRWMQEGRKPIVISMNVSRAHIGTPDFLSRLIDMADQYKVPHNLLELELTETILGGKREDIFEFITSCKNAGFLISIDDFGSGYSSLNLLKELPVDVLKIDREFLNETEESEKSSIIIEQVVEMATKIRIHTLCEGVETKAQAEFLKQIGCDMAQGYLYSRPVPVAEFEKMLGA